MNPSPLDPLRPIRSTPFGEAPFDEPPAIVLSRIRVQLPLADPTFLERVAAAMRSMALLIREVLAGWWAALRSAARAITRALRIPRRGWRSPARTLRRAAGPVPRTVRIARKRRRADLRGLARKADA